MLVIQSKKTGYNTKINEEIKKKIADHDHSSKLSAEKFDARL